MRTRMAFLATTFLAAPFAAPLVAHAQPIQGVYIGAAAGYDLPQNTKITPLTQRVWCRPPASGEGWRHQRARQHRLRVRQRPAPGAGGRFLPQQDG